MHVDQSVAEARPMRAALVGMPWFWAHMPSIQLAILKDILGSCDVESEVFEFYADFADTFGVDLYGKIANTGTYVGERLFSQFYFDELRHQNLEDIPPLAFNEPEIEKHILRFGTPLVDQFLDDCVAETDWARFDLVCLTLTAQQLGASMAFARRLKRRYPDLTVIIGGAGCAGDMGKALLRVCPEFEIAVHGEAEATLPLLVQALRDDASLETVEGVSWRDAEGAVRTGSSTAMHVFTHAREPLDFSAYFARVGRLPNLGRLPSWIPFESSRGCWYGEKSQCTFCGLNEIIKFRKRDTSQIFGELAHYEKTYGRTNFFSVDLIMPRSFLGDFLPAVREAGKDWTIFYEVKSNMQRAEVQDLAAAGINWIQPGIESLSDHVLKLMKKGVSAARNIQCLRLSREQGVTVSWNIISNFPQETARDYADMALMMKCLHHLDPPSGIAPFEVHRFSPFHEEPREHGITLKGPHHRYRSVFPVAEELLSEIVYRFEYDLIEPGDEGLDAARKAVADAVAKWKAAEARSCLFEIEYLEDGSAVLRDTRASEHEIVTRLPSHEAALLGFLDELKPSVRAVQLFAQAFPQAVASFGGVAAVEAKIAGWEADGTVLNVSDTLQSLATRRLSSKITEQHTVSDPELVPAQ